MLESSLWRYLKTIKDTFGQDDVYEDVTESLLESYRQNMLIHSDLTAQDLVEMDVWQYAQHYDLPTPLLDWTYSPFVALFFALRQPVIKPKQKSKRCIWVLDYAALNYVNSTVVEYIQENEKTSFRLEDGSPDYEYTGEYFPILKISREINGKNKRIYFQQGFFTQPGKLASIEVWANRISQEFPRPNMDRPLLTKIDFTCNESSRVKMLAELDLMNINYRTLFPDEYGAAKDAVERTYRKFMRPRSWQISFSSRD